MPTMTMLSMNGNAPAPDQELIARYGAEHQHSDVGQEKPGRAAELRPRSDEAAMLVGARPFHREQDRAAPFAAHADSLDEADDGQDDGAPDADRIVARHESDGEGGEAGDQQGRDQRRLAPDTVAIVAEDRRADRPGDEAHCVDGEGLQHADQRIRMREEQLAENQTGHGAVEEKIIPFDRRSDRAGNYRLAKL